MLRAERQSARMSKITNGDVFVTLLLIRGYTTVVVNFS